MTDIVLHTNVRIETDEDSPDKVWIYMIDPATGLEVEGGSFDSQLFLDAVLKFYNGNY